MQKSIDPIKRKMPMPIEFELEEGASISDGIITLTHKDASRIRILDVDSDKYLIFEIIPPKKTTTKPLKDYFGEDQLLKAVTTTTSLTGEAEGQYRYYKRGDCSYYALIIGKKTGSHRIVLGKLSDRNSPIYLIAKVIAYNLGSKKFTRKDLKMLIPRSMQNGQRLKSLLDTLHYEGYLAKEMAKTATQKEKEVYSATDKMKEIIIPSPSPEQA